MKEDIRQTLSTQGRKEFEYKLEKPHCIVLDSAYSSMGRMIGLGACKNTGYTYYDGATLLESFDHNFNDEDVEKTDVRLKDHPMTKEDILEDMLTERIWDTYAAAVVEALHKGPCLIHDHTAKSVVERLGYSCVSVFTYSSDQMNQIKRARVSPRYMNEEDDRVILEAIKAENMIRRNHHAIFDRNEWGQRNTYDLILNTDILGRDMSIKILADLMK